MKNLYYTELKNDLITWSPKLKIVIAIFIWTGLWFFNASTDTSIIGVIIGAVLILISVFQLGRKRIIILTDKSLYSETWIFGQRFVNTYDISKIKDLMYRKYVKSDLETTKSRQKVFGFDVTPDSSRSYYIHPEIIQFSYQGKTVSIGKYKKGFGGQKLFDLITELQNE